MVDLGPLTTEGLLRAYSELQKNAPRDAAIYVSPELYFEFTENFGAINSAYWPGSGEPEQPRVMLPVFFGLPVTIDPELQGDEWYTVDLDNNLVRLHVARPGTHPVEYGTIERKETSSDQR